MEDAEGQSGTFVTVRRYRDLSEAIVAKSLLESAGIPAWIRDENIARLEWQYTNLLGGVRLQVESSNKAAGEEVLAQPIPATVAFGEQENFEQPTCPACGSIDITYEGASRGAALVSVTMLSLPLPHGNTSWRCNSCGARWHDTADDVRPDAHVSSARGPSGYAARLGYRILPIAFAAGLLYIATLPGYAAFVRWSGLALAAVALGLGRKWIGETRMTRWAGIYLAVFVVFAAVLSSFGFAIAFGWVILPLMALTAAAILGDLFVGQPYKGRFSRARAERRGLP